MFTQNINLCGYVFLFDLCYALRVMLSNKKKKKNDSSVKISKAYELSSRVKTHAVIYKTHFQSNTFTDRKAKTS